MITPATLIKEDLMKTTFRLLSSLSLILLFSISSAYSLQFYKMTGGPRGGSFQGFSKAITDVFNLTNSKYRIDVFSSNGSVQNLNRVNEGRVHFGIVYAGDAYLAHQGKLARKVWKEKNDLRAVAFLYRSPAQMAVLADSPIMSVNDLAGKVVDLGGPGSGAEAAGKRFFENLGILHKMTVSNRGYSEAASDIQGKLVDAMWVLSGFPTPAIESLAKSNPIRLLDLYKPAQKAGFFSKHPYYQKITIPEGTYPGVNTEIDTFFDSTLLVAHFKVKDEIVEMLLEAIFSAEGLDYIRSRKSMASQTTVENGLIGVVIPLHRAAAGFWQKKGLSIPDRLTEN